MANNTVGPSGAGALAAGVFVPVIVGQTGSRIQVNLPTGSPGMRAFMQSLAVDDEEARVAQMPSQDIVVQIPVGTNLQRWAARVVRREGYWQAVLIQSRGQVQNEPCAHSCGTANAGNRVFLDCRAIPGYKSGSCGACVWKSHGARCERRA
ncbi:hypothetical protein PMIN07_012586 [Paraphaeosphaeria minitans]